MENQNTLTCDVTSDLMILYATGKASAETRRSIESHLQTCTACAQAFGRELQNKKRAQLPKANTPTELEDIFERLKYWVLPVWGLILFLLTRLVTFLDQILRRLGLSTTNLKIRLYRARRKVAGQLIRDEMQEQTVSA
jgi:predicted anti-sigma-YlaC factor YlaD